MTFAITDLGHNNAATTTVSLTVGASASVNDLVFVLACGDAGTPPPAVTDSAGNSYTSLGGGKNNNVDSSYTYLFYTLVTSPLTSGVSTITHTLASNDETYINAFKVTGGPSATPIDASVTNSGFGSSSSPSVTSGTPGASGEFFIGVIGYRNATSFTQDATHSWSSTGIGQVTGSGGPVCGSAGGSQVNAGTGTIIFAPTITSTPWRSIVIAVNSGGVPYTLTAAAGAFTLTGKAAVIGYLKTLTAAVGAFTLTGVAITAPIARKISAAVGAFTLTGQTATLKKALHMAGAAGSYVLTGQVAILHKGLNLIAAAGSYTLTGASLIIAELVSPATRLKRRISDYVFKNRRTTDPMLED